MSEYWKKHYNESSTQFAESLLKQVGKTVDGREVSDEQVQWIVDGLRASLKLCASDYVLDLCCGNGLLTRRYAPFVKHVVAVDYTPGFIDCARQLNQCENIEYINADVLKLSSQSIRDASKVIMYEALQHFTIEEFGSLLGALRDVREGALFFVASIPDRTQLRTYYDTEDKYAFHVRREAEGRPHIGRWWRSEEIERLAATRGFTMTRLEQRPSLYTAHYRFDVLLEKVP